MLSPAIHRPADEVQFLTWKPLAAFGVKASYPAGQRPNSLWRAAVGNHHNNRYMTSLLDKSSGQEFDCLRPLVPGNLVFKEVKKLSLGETRTSFEYAFRVDSLAPLLIR